MYITGTEILAAKTSVWHLSTKSVNRYWFAFCSKEKKRKKKSTPGNMKTSGIPYDKNRLWQDMLCAIYTNNTLNSNITINTFILKSKQQSTLKQVNTTSNPGHKCKDIYPLNVLTFTRQEIQFHLVLYLVNTHDSRTFDGIKGKKRLTQDHSHRSL